MSLLDRIRKALEPDYAVERELGAGGMGVVFEALDTRLERKVAVKVLRPEHATALATERFLREARLMARLKHPGVVKVHDTGEGDGLSWFIMDLVEGETLQSRLKRGPLSYKETIHLGRELLSALAAAHERGIVHRDVKPANIFIENGHALLADFGIARTSTTSGSDPGLTDTAGTIGTPAYMSPEQNGSGKVGPASDQYSLALVLYECLMGKQWRKMDAPEAGDWTGVPSPVAAVLKQALAFEPAKRWTDAATFAVALQPVPTRKRWYLGAASVGAATILVIRGCPPPPPPCQEASKPYSPGISATVPCERYGSWLAAERIFATGNWQAADTAYRNLLEKDTACLACDFRLIEVNRWLEQPSDPRRVSALQTGTSQFNPEWARLVAASFEPAGRRIEALDQLANDYKAWPLAWSALGTELFNRGSFFGHRRSDAIEALNQQAALDSSFVPAFTDRALALIAAGDSTAAAATIARLLALPDVGGLAQAQRLLASLAFAFRFTSHGVEAWRSAQRDSTIDLGRREVAAGPRFLPGLGTPLGAVELGREFERSGLKPWQRSGLIAEMLGSLALGRIESTHAAGRRLNAMFPSNEFLAFDVMLEAAAILLDNETTASEADQVEQSLRDFTRPMMPPGVRRDAAWLRALAQIKKKDPRGGHEALSLLADEPAPAFRQRFVEGALIAASGKVDSALAVTDGLATDLEAWDRADRSALLRAAARISRAKWLAATGVPETARSEYRWHEHFHMTDYPVDSPLPADGDWAFSTLAYWQQARLLDHTRPGETADRDVCVAYRQVAERWALGDARYRARADTARARLAALHCDPS